MAHCRRAVIGLRLASGRRLPLYLLALVAAVAWADFRLPGSVIQRLPRPWPPVGWSLQLVPQDTAKARPYRSEPMVRDGYFGQTLYRQIPGTQLYWTANVLIQDRGSPAAAWHAVSAVTCPTQVFRGYRARECTRGDPTYLTRTLHYEVGRFYVTVQLAGPGETDYPLFDLAGTSDFPTDSPFMDSLP
jgi:hypothetical protein